MFQLKKYFHTAFLALELLEKLGTCLYVHLGIHIHKERDRKSRCLIYMSFPRSVRQIKKNNFIMFFKDTKWITALK